MNNLAADGWQHGTQKVAPLELLANSLRRMFDQCNDQLEDKFVQSASMASQTDAQIGSVKCARSMKALPART